MDDFEALEKYLQGDVSGDYNPDVSTVIAPNFSDSETAKLLRQQEIAQSGGSPLGNMGGTITNTDWLSKLFDAAKGFGGKALDFAGTDKGLFAILAALAAAADRAKPSGGGYAKGYAGFTPGTRSVVQGPYGPIAKYAAQGGIMHAYNNGGKVQMEDGGFVMTKRAVDGAGGPQGIARLVPGARMIRGPGNGTSDSIPAEIRGRNGVTPARVSNGEAYIPRAEVQRQGGAPEMYALMNSLQRRA